MQQKQLNQMHPEKLNSNRTNEFEESALCHEINFQTLGSTHLAAAVDDCARAKDSSHSIASKSTTASENADLDEIFERDFRHKCLEWRSFDNDAGKSTAATDSEEHPSDPPGDVAPTEMEIFARYPKIADTKQMVKAGAEAKMKEAEAGEVRKQA